MTLVTPFTCWNTACTPQKQPPANTAVSVPFAVARGVSATALGTGVAASDSVHADRAISGSALRVLSNPRTDKRSMQCPPKVSFCVCRVGRQDLTLSNGFFDLCAGQSGRAPPRAERHLHDCLMKLLISSGDAKTTEARSPCMPAPTITGLPGAGPSLLESVLKRRLNSQTLFTLPSAVFTV